MLSTSWCGNTRAAFSGVLERKQGVAYARNAGIGAARAEIVAFFDDDVRVAPDWIETIRRVFRERPDLECRRRKSPPGLVSATTAVAHPHALGAARAPGFWRHVDAAVSRESQRAHQREPLRAARAS